jgi:hypothetical protein
LLLSCLGLVQAHLTLIYETYIGNMLWRVRNHAVGPRMRLPLSFIHVSRTNESESWKESELNYCGTPVKGSFAATRALDGTF